MLEERFTRSIPDEIPEDHEEREEIEDAFTKLRLKITTNQRRRIQIAQQYGVTFDPQSQLDARFDLLADAFLGVLTPERLEFEHRWQNIITDSIENMAATIQEAIRRQRESKTLHLPGGRQHVVPPEKENGNGE